MAHGEVITFYSYKGGVGRSMALANTATLLAQAGKRVLAMDFDLEAPGLLRYFKRVEGSGPGAAGVIEFFAELRQRFEEARARASEAAGSEELPAGMLSSELEDVLRASVVSLVEDARFFRRATVANPNVPGATAVLALMPAGHYDESYPDRVRKFPWEAFYEAHPYFVEFLIDALCERYDYVLVDSRTGTTDVGNLCTVLLPEKLVLVSTPNEQSLNGATEVGRQAVEVRKASADLRPLPLFPLLSRVENAEDGLQRTWIRDAKSRFESVFSQVYGIQKPLTVYFDAVQIPHKSFYAYGEVIAAERERLTEARSLVAAYREFVDALRSNNAVDAQELMSARIISPSKAQEAASVAQQQSVVLAEKVLAAEQRSQDLEERLQQLQPSKAEAGSFSPTAHAPENAPRKMPRWGLLATGAALTTLALTLLLWSSRRAEPSREAAVLAVSEEPSSSANAAVSDAARKGYIPTGAKPAGTEPIKPLSPDPTPATAQPAGAAPEPEQQEERARPRPSSAPKPASPLVEDPPETGLLSGAAAISEGAGPARGPDPALLQIVRGDLQRENLKVGILPDTFSGRTLVLGSYSSPTQARTNLARVRKVQRDAGVYYSSNRFYAVAVPATSDNFNQVAGARRVSPDAYLIDAHGWIKIDFK